MISTVAAPNPASRWRLLSPMCCILLGMPSGARADVKHRHSDEATEVAFLIRQGTADSFATASLLVHLIQDPDDGPKPGMPPAPEPSQLIERAVSLAPDRPELIWIELRDCETRRCGDEVRIAARLKETDPQNGLASLADLNAAQGNPDDVTRAIEQIGGAQSPRVYWNRLVVMMFDALTHHGRADPPTAITEHADDRLMHAAGVLAALDIPAFRPLAYACRRDELAAAGRRAACEKAMERLEESDAVLTQLVRQSVLEAWWPPSTPEGAELRRERLQRRYLTVASNRIRPGHADGDAQARIEAMRRLPREEDVERAMLTLFHEPIERPADWHGPETAP